MTSRAHRPHSSLGPRRAQWLTVLCVLALTLLSPRAHAAAPLCDPSGASMPAPIPVLPNATGDLVAPKGCDDQTHQLLDLVKPNGGESPAVRAVDVPDRVVVSAPVWPKVSGTKIPRPSRASVPELPGHSLPVYRPPRA